MKFDVIINVDDAYLQHAMTMLCSLYENNRSHSINLHVLTGKMSLASRNYIEDLSIRYDNKVFWHVINNERLEGVKFRKERPLSYAAYYRLLIADVLPKDIHKVLYLDCDMIILKDVSDIFELDIKNYALAATYDDFPFAIFRYQFNIEVDEKTFCSGIMLINLDFWRENDSTFYLLKFAKAKKEPVFYHDQDVLNYIFKNKWYRLPPNWNRISFYIRLPRNKLYKDIDYVEYFRNPIILHYGGPLKPWGNGYCPFRSYYRKYLQISGYDQIKFSDISRKQWIKNLYSALIYNIKTKMIRLLKKY